MIIVGLTGSIGMGKTATAKMFEDAGAFVFDADAAVHALYAKNGAAVPLLRAVFPDVIVAGAVDRGKLLVHLKKDTLNIEVLESFIHPMVLALRQDAIALAKVEGHEVFVADIPLLFETGGDALVDKIVVVSAPDPVRRQRVLARPGMTPDKLDAIIARQMPDAQKRARADYVVETSGGLDDARRQVDTLLRRIRENDQG